MLVGQKKFPTEQSDNRTNASCCGGGVAIIITSGPNGLCLRYEIYPSYYLTGPLHAHADHDGFRIQEET
jgi:hypothetical protein